MLSRIEATPSTVLDVGAGTGRLLLALAARWPDARIVALDGSAGMLSVARQRVAQAWPGRYPAFEWLVAEASSMPLPDGSIDLVTVAFVLELVDDRRRLLREIARVLRPGGTLGLVSLMSHELVCEADVAFEALLDEWDLPAAGAVAGFRTSPDGGYRMPDELVRELSEAGFCCIEAETDELHHAWTPADYLGFKEDFDERDLFDSLDAAERSRFRRALHQHLAGLPAAAFELRGAVVTAVARRSER
jgi:ubiquinone/menaquinone biosynthesis C-methylase UbiE